MKQGLDDLFAAGGTPADLIAMSKPAAAGLKAITDAKPKAASVVGTKQSRTNTGSMFRLKQRFAGRFAWDPSTKWYAWSEGLGRWEEDAEHRVRAAITRELPEIITDEIEQLSKSGVSDEEIGKHRAYLMHVQSAGHQRDTLTLLSPEMLVRWQDFDADLGKITVGNGTLHFDGGKVTLEEHDPSDLITRSSPTNYEPKAPRKFWESTLARFVPNDEIRAFLQRFAGAVLVGGGVREQVLPIMFGTGANGKSTFVNGLRAALGEELAIEVDPATLRQDTRSGAAPSPDKMRLRGARYVYAVEATGHLDAQLLKRLTGGEEIVARQLHGKTISFKPQFTLTIIANEEPQFDDTSEGLWRRVKRIPFDVRIPEGERMDAALVSKLFQEEAEGILAWCVEGYKMYARDGLSAPAAIELSSNRMRADADPVRRFVADHIAAAEGAVLKPTDVWAVWREWVRDNEPGDEAGKLGSTKFKQAVSAILNTQHDGRGYVEGKRARGWCGYVLQDEATEEDAGQKDKKSVPEVVFPDTGGTKAMSPTNGTEISVLSVPEGLQRRVTGLVATFNFTDSEDWRRLYRKQGE